MRIVLDTNVLVAAHAATGLCYELSKKVLKRHALVLSTEILAELERALARKLGMTPERAASIVHALSIDQVLVEAEVLPASACRDPGDLVILGTATAGKADLLVSGDLDLLSLKSFRGIRIVSPRACIERLDEAFGGGAGRAAEKRLSWRRAKPAVPRARRRKAGKG